MIYLIVGNSGSGKTTQAKLLQKKNNFNKIITYTTRPIRSDEINNVDYHFVNTEQFKDLSNKNELTGITKFSNNYYGISKKELDYYKNSNKNCVLIVDLKGVKELKNEFNAICIYLKANNDNLLKRMQHRNEHSDILKLRMECIEDFSPYADYTINADKSIEEVNNEISKIVEKHLK